ncbi:MAG: c-type cytochrome [Haliscomenobacter sp.]|nr:c-type cytochrome [Haliscomenobacter sp.]MBK7477427.1 c-type cytochrome [Haliscomenobacter sp.]MBK8877414.1 c-type cytochrome [Haliscomenobacter sp.]
MRKILLLLALGVFMSACAGKTDKTDKTVESMMEEEPLDPGKGYSEIKHVPLNDPLNAFMVSRGKTLYEMKCASCHVLDDPKVIGPGWKGVTERRSPEWIMNMITNVNIMLATDSTAQALLKDCLVRMPAENISVGDARDILEFMFANDGKPVGK